VVDWVDNHFNQIRTALISLGCPLHKQTFHKGSCLAEHLETLQGQIAAVEKDQLTHYLGQYQKYLSGETTKQDAHSLWKE
jgi:hypothetical protein